jgi:hypothetical protein
MKKAAAPKKASAPKIVVPKYPRHSLEKVLRIPKAILDQNAGKECSDEDTATFLGIKYNRGAYSLELSSAMKSGLLERPSVGRIAVSELAKKILRPQNEQEELVGLREAVLKAPDISTVYSHYRGENLPDMQFFDNALVDKFGIPKDKVAEFKTIFFDTLNNAKLIEEHNGKQRLLDVSGDVPTKSSSSDVLKKLGKSVTLDAGDSCFVMMPFAAPLGNYYEKVYKPAIEKAGLKPVRADAEIFGTGKIMDQVWSGINAAKVLVAEMTTRNPNVFLRTGSGPRAQEAGRPRLIQRGRCAVRPEAYPGYLLRRHRSVLGYEASRQGRREHPLRDPEPGRGGLQRGGRLKLEIV